MIERKASNTTSKESRRLVRSQRAYNDNIAPAKLQAERVIFTSDNIVLRPKAEYRPVPFSKVALRREPIL